MAESCLICGTSDVFVCCATTTEHPVPAGMPIPNSTLFDIGVFLVVAGVVLMMIFSLAEES